VRVNAAPVAEAGTDQQAAVGQSITLDAGQSYDADGRISAYLWDLGDGTEQSGPRVQHAYAAPGRYEVTLSVRDDAGVDNSSASDRLRVQVNSPPVAVAGPDHHVAVG